jgi:DNA gyrase subunit A
MVQRTSVSGISQMGRSTQGVKVMNIKDDDVVSAVALVVESEDAQPADDSDQPPMPSVSETE